MTVLERILYSQWNSRKNNIMIANICLILNRSTVKHLPTMRETRLRSLSREDPLEREMETHSSTLARRIPWMEPGGLQSMGSQWFRHDWATSLHFTSGRSEGFHGQHWNFHDYREYHAIIMITSRCYYCYYYPQFHRWEIRCQELLSILLMYKADKQ